MKPSQATASLQLGKAGPTERWLEGLAEQVRKRKLVKVRILRTVTPETGLRAFAQDLARGAGCRLVEVRGRTAVFRPAFGTE